MDNYHYIVAGLPVVEADYRFTDQTPELMMEEIREQLSDKDNALVDFLMKGFQAENLCMDFYREALTHQNRFIREWFAFDLHSRNAKVAWLNRQLGRPADKDILDVNADEDLPAIDCGEFEEAAALEAVLSVSDLLARERGVDELSWDKLGALTTFDYFDIEAVLAFICKLQIAARWFRLDEASGREMFRRLVDEIRGTFKGVHYEG